MKNPIQPITEDEKGVARFKKNKIVEYLLDNGAIDLNQLAVIDFSNDDRQQFAQLIGYSLSGYSELTSYVDDTAYYSAEAIYKKGIDEKEARIEVLENLVSMLKNELRLPMSKLFEVHEDDLK